MGVGVILLKAHPLADLVPLQI